MTKIEPYGYVVVESCEDYSQILALDIGPDKPPGGVLTWAAKGIGKGIVFFGTKPEARAAIARTEHYRKAFGLNTPPEKKFCSVQLIARVHREA